MPDSKPSQVEAVTGAALRTEVPQFEHTLIRGKVLSEANTNEILYFGYASSHGSFNVTVRGDD